MSMRFFCCWFIAILCFAEASSLQADISLPQMFSDNMVLQRESKTKIHGTAEPSQKLTVQFAATAIKVTADAAGKWSVVLPTGEAGGPYELTVTADEGQPQIKLSNVMVGEVWLCSGQSNMQWPVSKVLNAKREIEQSINYPTIRFLTVSEKPSIQPLDNFEKVIGWNVCSPDSVRDFSGAAYFFARELTKQFPDIPIGLINASSGGTTCEAWVSRSGLTRVKRLEPLLEHWSAIQGENRNRPSVLFNGMISPLKDYPFRGVLWYQGEANNGRGEQYRRLFPAMIGNWRSFFRRPKMPFYFVQLAPFRYPKLAPEALPEVWDAQLKTLRATEHTGMVVTTDVGDVADIHPKNKQAIGRRLSLLAISNLYLDKLAEDKKDIVPSGPIYQSLAIKDGKVRLTFKYSKGLKIYGTDQELSCFTICGEDKKFVPAIAKIVGDSVEVFSESVPSPVAVRLGWSDTAQPNLVNGANLPASPFRSDNFPLLSEGKDF